MKKIKSYIKFISEDFGTSAPEIDIKPGIQKPETQPLPLPPGIIPDDSPEDAPAKAELPMASAEDVVGVFINLINKSGDDIKKYVEMR
jgi:hypothetical protein